MTMALESGPSAGLGNIVVLESISLLIDERDGGKGNHEEAKGFWGRGLFGRRVFGR